MTDSDEVKLLPCAFCRSQMQLGLQMFKHPAMDDGECPLQDLAFRNELAGAWNTRPPVVTDEVVERVANKIYANVHHLMGVTGVRAQEAYESAARSILASTPAVVSGGQGDPIDGFMRMHFEDCDYFTSRGTKPCTMDCCS